MKKRLAVLLAGMTLVGANAFAGNLSYKQEVKVNDYKESDTKIEWTLALGSYGINDTFKFLYDVDRDLNEGNDGWDTQFGVAQSIGDVHGFNTSLYYLLRYDQVDDGDATVQYIVSPTFSRSVKLMEKDFDFTAELWAQMGATGDGELKDISGAEANFYLSGTVADNLDLAVSWYNFNYYDGTEYDYQAGADATLTYSLPLKYGVSVAVENFAETYYTPDTKEAILNASIEPSVKYSKKINDSFSWNAGLTYEIFDYAYTDTDGTTSISNNDDNEMEISASFTYKK
jgi:hypothetical protein